MGIPRCPIYDKLWVDCSKDEARLTAKHGNAYDENQALATSSSHHKGKKKFDRRDLYRRDRDDRRYDGSSYSSNRRDYSKTQCFGCKELGHIKRDCLKEKGKKRASRAEIDNEPPNKKTRDEHSLDSDSLCYQLFQVPFRVAETPG